MNLDTVESFQQAVDLFAQVYSLNDQARADLDRIKQPELAQQIIDAGCAQDTLRMLCPEANVYFEHDSFYDSSYMTACIRMPAIGFVLSPLMLLRRFVAKFDKNATFLHADGTNVNIGEYETSPPLATIMDVNLGPQAPERNVQQIIGIVSAMIGQQLDYHDYVDAVSIKATRRESGRDWKSTNYEWDVIKVRMPKSTEYFSVKTYPFTVNHYPTT